MAVGALAGNGAAAATFGVRITGVPTNGTVYLSDGVSAVSAGETLTPSQLAGLKFVGAAAGVGQTAQLTYQASDATGWSASGAATRLSAGLGIDVGDLELPARRRRRRVPADHTHPRHGKAVFRPDRPHVLKTRNLCPNSATTPAN